MTATVKLLGVVSALIFLLAAPLEAAAGTIEGMVSTTAGRGGWVHLSVKSNGSPRETGLGASILVDATPASFSISGVADGSYSLYGYLDAGGSGVRHANDQAMLVKEIVVSGGNGNAGLLALTPPPAVLPERSLSPPTVIPTREGVAVIITELPMAGGLPIPEQLVISCGDAGTIHGVPGVANILANLQVPAGVPVSCSTAPVVNGETLSFLASPPSAPVMAQACDAQGSCDPEVTARGEEFAASLFRLFPGTSSPATSFEPGKGPIVSGIMPSRGPAGTVVSIIGSNLADAIVSFGGVTAPVTSGSDAVITTTVPPHASSGPVQVRAGERVEAAPFTSTIAYSGTVTDAGGNALPGIIAALADDSGNAASSDNGGVFSIPSIPGIPAGLPFVVKITDPDRSSTARHDAYSSFLRSTSDLDGGRFTLFSTPELQRYGFSAVADGSKGMIVADLMDNGGRGIGGAVVSATSWLKPDAFQYVVRYDDGYGQPSPDAASTGESGRFYVVDVEDGDIVKVAAAKPGWGIAPNGFPVRAGAVSQGTMTGDPMPTVSLSPAPGEYPSPLQVTLTPSSPAVVYCTTDGTDPADRRSECSGPVPLTGTATIRYVVKNGAGVYGGAGEAAYVITGAAGSRAAGDSMTPTTITMVSATPNPSTYRQPVTMTAVLSPVGASGQVQFSSNLGWQEVVDVSTVSGSAAVTTISLPAGNHAVSARYLGDAGHEASPVSASLAVIVEKGTATVSLAGLDVTYDGNAKPVTVTTVPAGLAVAVTYNGSSQPPATAGSYTVIATVTDDNYRGSAGGTLVIAKTQTTVSRPVTTPNPSVYGQPVTFSAAVSPPGGGGKMRFTSSSGWQEEVDVSTISGSATATTATLPAGSSYVTAQYLGDENHEASLSTGMEHVVNKAIATVTLGNLAAVYDGIPHAATAATSPAGLPVTVTYNGSVTPPTAAGSYSVLAVIYDANFEGTALGTLVIAKGATTVTGPSASPNPAVYGQPVVVAATVAPAGGNGKIRFAGANGWQESVDVSTVTGSAAAIATLPAGTHSITAQYLGDANNSPSPVSLPLLLLVNKAAQSISFAPLPTKTLGAPPFAITATATSGLPVQFSSSNPAVATVNGGTVTLVGAGVAIVTASQGGDGNYLAAAPVTRTLTVMKGTAAVTLGGLSGTYDGTPHAATATTTPAGLTVTFTYDGTPNAPIEAGSYTVVGTVTDANYTGTASGAMVIAKAEQSINFSPLPAKQYGDAPFIVAGTATSGLPVTFTSSDPSVATVSGTTVTIVGAGSTVITAGQAGGPNHNAAPAVTQILLVAKAPLTVRAADASRVYGIANPAFTTTYSGFVNGDTAAVISGVPAITTVANTASPAGTYPIIPSIGSLAAANYTFAFENGTLTILKADQTITYPALAVRTYGDAPFAPVATASSGLAVSYTSSNPAVATVSGGTITIVGAGTADITAGQAGDGNWNPSAPVTRTLTVNKKAASVSLSNLVQNYDGTPKTVTVTTDPPGLSVFVTYDGEPIPPTKKGTYIVVATVNDPNYQGSANGTLQIKRGTQRIIFDPLPQKTYGDAAFLLTATASSGLPVSYTSSNTAVATVSGSTVTIVGTGTTIITATQDGDADFNAAQPVSQTLAVSKASLTVTAADKSRAYGAANPALTVQYSGFVYSDTSSVLTGAPALVTTATATTPAGTVPITVSAGTLAAANYAFVFANGTLTITKAPLNINPVNATRSYGAADPVFTASYSGFVNSETAAVLSGAPEFSTNASANSTPGSYQITATAGTLAAANYSFVFNTGTLTIVQATQSLSFAALTPAKYGDPAISLTGTATSGLAVSYTSSNPAVATVSGSTVTITGVGTTTITASQGGNDNYAAATPVAQPLTVQKGTATVTLGSPTFPYDGTPKPITVTTNPQGLAVTVTYAGSPTPPTAAGNYAVTAIITDPKYDGSASGTLTVAKANQAITFGDLPAHTVGDAPFSLSVTASSGLPVSLTSSNPAVATISGTTVTIVGAGTAVITASQAGNSNYNAASAVTRTLAVNPISGGIKVRINDTDSYYPTIGAAYAAIPPGMGGELRLPAGDVNESLVFDRNCTVTLIGGFNTDFTVNSGTSTVRGIVITNGTVIMDKIVLQ